jgi:hypothetical protein
MKKTNKKTSTKTVRGNRTNKKDTAPVAKAKPETKSLPDLRDDSASKNTVPLAIPVVMTEQEEKKSRGGFRDSSEPQAKTVQCVRGEFLSDFFKPKITLTHKTMTFNMSCVNLLQNCQHVRIFIDESNLRLFVEPTREHDKNGLKFANLKGTRNVPRTCTINYFCLMLFDFMKWNPNAKYRILTIYQEFEGKKYLVFNLDEAQQVFSETIETKDGKKRRRPTPPIFPPNWKERFGYKMDELEDSERLDFGRKLITIDHKTGERQVSNVEPQPPTPENLMHEQYGGIRTRKEKPKNDD